MDILRRYLAAVLLAALAAPAAAFVLRTTADASAGACCRPDGSAHGFASFTFSVQLTDVEPQHFGRQLAYALQANDQCDYGGLDFISTATSRVPISASSGATVTTVVNSPPLMCFFNARGRAVASFAGEVAREESVCEKPCPDCVPWGPVP